MAKTTTLPNAGPLTGDEALIASQDGESVQVPLADVVQAAAEQAGETVGAEAIAAVNATGAAQQDMIETAGEEERADIAAAALAAATARIADILAVSSGGLYLNTYATTLPKGVTSGVVGGAAVTGATPAEYPLTLTGGDIAGMALTLVVTSATAAFIRVDKRGLGSGTTPPTITKPAGATLPAGTTLTAVVGSLIDPQREYVALSADLQVMQAYKNDGSATPAILPFAIPTNAAFALVRDSIPTVSGVRDKVLQIAPKDATGARRVVFDLDVDASIGFRSYLPMHVPAGNWTWDSLAADVQARIPFDVVTDRSGIWFALVDKLTGRSPFIIWEDGRLAISATVERAKVADSCLGGFILAETADYILDTVTDGAGDRQVRKFDKETGRFALLTGAHASSLGDNTSPVLTSDAKVVFYNAARAKRLYTTLMGGAAWPVDPDADWVWWGDSLSQVDSGVNAPAHHFATAAGVECYNGGAGSQNTPQISARQGGAPMLVTVAGNQIPGTGSVAVTARSTTVLSPSLPGPMTGTINGVAVTLTRNAGDESNSLARVTPGDAVACPAGTPFIPDLAVLYRNRKTIMWTGRNDFTPFAPGGYAGAGAIVDAGVDAMIAHLSPYRRQYLVLGVTNKRDGTEDAGSSNLAAIDAHNAAQAAKHGARFFDVRRWAIDHGLAACGITPTVQDLADIALDRPPQSLMADVTHFNVAFNAALGVKVNTIRLDLGY